ncbi:MAG: hypothetical protein KKF54_06710 [Candidatus Omnitrophica bacterium]|nr:hypothetical protein [Candidatus Omnitrophota bacterium]
MDKKRINEIAEFFYSSNNASDVPLRIMATTGMYSAFDFPKEGLIELLHILNKSKNLKDDLMKFREKYDE